MIETGTDGVTDFDQLQNYFFKKYMKIVTTAADFNIDGWEEVWEFEKKGLLSKKLQ